MIVHPTAIIHPDSIIGLDVKVGPYSVIDEKTKIGESTNIGSNVRICRFTEIGSRCRIFHGAVLGEIPQDLKFAGEETDLVIEEDTTIREYVTINRGTSFSGSTQIGKSCLLLAYVHVAHDCRIGDHVVLSNAVNLAGHVQIEDYAGVGGMVPVHQFVRIGRHAFVGGGYRVAQDIPPYILAAGEPLGYKGLNYVGLRRNEIPEEVVKQIEKAYHIVYRSGLSVSTALTRMKEECRPIPEIQAISHFIESSLRGIIR